LITLKGNYLPPSQLLIRVYLRMVLFLSKDEKLENIVWNFWIFTQVLSLSLTSLGEKKNIVSSFEAQQKYEENFSFGILKKSKSFLFEFFVNKKKIINEMVFLMIPNRAVKNPTFRVRRRCWPLARLSQIPVTFVFQLHYIGPVTLWIASIWPPAHIFLVTPINNPDPQKRNWGGLDAERKGQPEKNLKKGTSK